MLKKFSDPLDDLLDQAERRYEQAQNDEVWILHFMIWHELHQLKYGGWQS